MKDNLSLIEVSVENAPAYIEMACALWPDADITELHHELADSQVRKKHWLCQNEAGLYVGFIDLSIRSDYVEGCATSPVGYVEGIYVKPKYRKQQVGLFLIKAGEHWAKSHGCTEFASDTEMHNLHSQHFHEHVGFTGKEVVVHFWKSI